MTPIADNIKQIKSQLPSGVKLVAVSKTKPVEDILEAYSAGQRIFGENRVQEILNKKDVLPLDIEWHLIGHLQTNKVKQIISYVNLIHSVDSFKLLSVIDDEAEKSGRIIDCLLQVHIAKEESKTGFLENELKEMLSTPAFRELKNVRIRGLMGMATFTDDEGQVREEFRSLSNLFKELKSTLFKDSNYFSELSMGMSGDYSIAVDEGSTMVRIGSLVFGRR